MKSALLLAVTFLYSAGALSADPALRVFYTHDGMGELEPCGCRANPLGGVIRLKNGLQARKNSGAEIYVDSGNAYFEAVEVPDGLAESARLQSLKLAEAHRALGLKLYVPGEKDFALGWSHLLKLKAAAGTRFLSLNLKAPKNAGVFEPSFAVKAGETNYRFVGLHGVDLRLNEPSLSLGDPDAALKSHLEKSPLAANEKLIVLSELGMEKDQALAKAFPSITVIIGSRDQLFTQKPVVVGTTLIVQTSYRNQHLGVLDFSGETAPTHELVPLEESFEKGPDPKLAKILKDWKAQSKKLVAKLEKTSRAKGTIQTFPACVSCHETITNFWLGTRHASALTALEEKDQFSQPACLQCHSVRTDRGALTLKDGVKKDWLAQSVWMKELVRFAREKTPPPHPTLENVETAYGSVQCENCHGPAGNHPFEGQVKKAVAEATCLKCHTAERAPTWYEGKALKHGIVAEKKVLIRCPAEGNP